MLNLSSVNQKDYTPFEHLNIKFSIKQNKKGTYSILFENLRYLTRCKKLDSKVSIRSGELKVNSVAELENILEQIQDKIIMSNEVI